MPLFMRTSTPKGKLQLQEEGCSGMGFTIMESLMASVKVGYTPGKGTTVRMRMGINH